MRKSADAIDAHVGAQIRLRRKALHVSQTKMAEHLGVTFQQVQKYEKGTNRVGASRLQAISGFLGVEVAYFFSGAPVDGEDMAIDTGAEENGLRNFIGSAEGFALNQAFYRVKSPVVRRRFLSLVKTLAGE